MANLGTMTTRFEEGASLGDLPQLNYSYPAKAVFADEGVPASRRTAAPQQRAISDRPYLARKAWVYPPYSGVGTGAAAGGGGITIYGIHP